MADKVQKRLEDFVPDLHDLLSHGLFNQHEIKKVVENRRKFEFEILSSDPNISLLSYKDYLKFEMELDKMIQSRLKNFKRNKLNNRIYNLNNFNNNQSSKLNGSFNDLNNQNNQNKLKLYKLKINNKRYIHNIFRRCLNRFVNNVDMYKMYLGYCTKIKANKLFERVIIDGLSKNPNNESMWLILGSFLLNNKGLTRSKNVVQRALRIIPDSLDLILYLFKLEIKSLLLVSNNYINNTSKDINGSNPNCISSGNNHNDAIETLNRSLIIFKYGIDNLKKNNDLIVFYFSVLNILCKLRSKVFDNDFGNNGFNTIFDNNKIFTKEINKLLDTVNSLIKDKNIPIIRLYNYQIHLMERILIKNVDRYINSTECELNHSKDGRTLLESNFKKEINLEMEIESNLTDIIHHNLDNLKNHKENDTDVEDLNNNEHINNNKDGNGDEDKSSGNINNYNNITANNKIYVNDVLVLYLQFLYNILSNRLQIDNSNKINNSDDNINGYLCDLEKEYIVNKYCILENVYYLCLLGRIPSSLNRCKNTSYLISVKHLNYLYNLFKNYYNDLINNYQLVDFILKINIGNDTHNIYFYLKLFLLLLKIIGNNITNNCDDINNGTSSSIIDYNKLISNKIKQISIQLSQIKNIDNDELIYLILKLKIDFILKLKIINNFSKISKFNINYLFECQLNESEIIDLFLILVKLDNNFDFTIFLDRFIGNYNSNLNCLLDKLTINNNFNKSKINNNTIFLNNIIKYILIRIDSHLNQLNCLYTINNMDDIIKSLNSIVDLSKLNKLVIVNSLDNNNKSLLDNLNTKLNLLGLDIYRN